MKIWLYFISVNLFVLEIMSLAAQIFHLNHHYIKQ